MPEKKRETPAGMTTDDVVARLKALARPEDLAGMERYGMTAEGRLGVRVPEIRALAKAAAHDLGAQARHSLALDLWATGIIEARMVATMIDDAALVTPDQADAWVADLNAWDLTDQLCMNLLEDVPFADQKIEEWSRREEEYIKRAAFALIACIAWHDKRAPDERFLAYWPILMRGATDERNYVKKAVNWALRNIGKRNRNLNRAAITLAEQLQRSQSKAARWIAGDALRELQSDKVQARLKG